MAETTTPTRQAWLRGSSLGAALLLAAALMGMVNYLAAKHYRRWDWTSSRLFTLSEKSLNLARELDRNVDAVIFLSPEDPLFEPTRELLSRYAAASPRFQLRVVDPQRNIAEARTLVDRYEIERSNVIVLATEDDRRILDGGELAEMDFSAMQQGLPPRMTAFRGEQLISSALVELTEERKPKIVFTSGHDELQIDDTSPEGLSELRRLLGKDNFEIDSWSPLTEPEVPQGTDLVIVAGPRTAFLEPELAALTRFLEAGGRALLLLDPQVGEGAQQGLGLASWLQGYGVELGENLVVDPDRTVPFFSDETFAAGGWADHTITRPLRQAGVPVILSLARSIGRGGEAGELRVSELLHTTAGGWGETDLAGLPNLEQDESDLGGPVPLAVAVESPEQDSDDSREAAVEGGEAAPSGDEEAAGGEDGAGGLRMVVVGNSAFAANRLLPNAGNPALVSNLFNWLVEREALLGIPAKEPEQVRLDLDPVQERNLHLLVLALMPAAAILAGIFIRYRRRR